MGKNVRIGTVQMACTGDTSENIARTIRKIREVAHLGAQIICLQELFASLYFCHEENIQYFNLAEPIPGPLTEQLQAIAQELKVVLIASLFEKRAPGLYHNTAVVIDADGSYLGKYRKMHIPDDPGFYEKFYFTPGDLGYQVFRTRYAKIGILICWDQWFPEAARITSLMGAELLFYPTAIGWDTSQVEQVNKEEYEAWQTIQRGHAIANGIPVIAVNRVGQEHGTFFWGGSMIVNPFGSLLYEAPQDQEEVHVQEVSLEQSEHYRKIWPFFRDRRIDTYHALERRFIEIE